MPRRARHSERGADNDATHRYASGMNARFIDTDAGLDDVAAALAAAPWVALDSESNSMFVYKEQVCLLQLNAGGALFVVDPLALGVTSKAITTTGPSAALLKLKPGLERNDRPLYLHGGEYDVAVVRRDFGIVLGGVYDSQQAASLLGHEKTGYGSLVELLCGVKLGKAFATYDWATRPLDGDALAYAIDDVVYLPKIVEKLRADVDAAGIVDEVNVANAAVAAQVWSVAFDPERFWRMKDLEQLDELALKTLKRLYVWRDAAAKSDDVPAGRFVNDEVLKWLARHRPSNIAALRQGRFKPSLIARHGDDVVSAIVGAAGDDVPRQPPRPTVPRDVLAREDRLKAWRRREGEERSVKDGRTIPLQLVLPARALEALKQSATPKLDEVPQLGAARIARYGATLLQLCQAPVAASPSSETPLKT